MEGRRPARRCAALKPWIRPADTRAGGVPEHAVAGHSGGDDLLFRHQRRAEVEAVARHRVSVAELLRN